MTTKVYSKESAPTNDLKVVDDVPIDKKIEHLIRSHKELTITRRVENVKFVTGADSTGVSLLPEGTIKRLESDGIDLSKGYPEIPDRSEIPVFIDQAYAIRDYDVPYVERGTQADPDKKSLFGAAKEVINLTDKVGTEIVGLQLEDLTDKQKDELALLIAERIVVFFRDQKLSPRAQLKLGEYYGNVEIHPQTPHVTGLPGATVIWNDYKLKQGLDLNFSNANFSNWDRIRHVPLGNQTWHTDLVHERQPAGYTHLHLDSIPEVGGDTMWSSGYAAYDKLSDEFKRFLDGKQAVYISANSYLNRDDPLGGPGRVERVHPLVRTHPATGWKYLFVNRAMTKRIIGISPIESDLILSYLFDVYEKNADIQVRFKWNGTSTGLGTSAIWDNRISQHRNVWDHEGKGARHGTRVTALAEKPYFDPTSKSQREALGLPLKRWT